jgi:hypothetical protein
MVSGWNDRSGNNNNAATPLGPTSPVQNVAALNGYPIVTFDGIDDQLQVPDANSLDCNRGISSR